MVSSVYVQTPDSFPHHVKGVRAHVTFWNTAPPSQPLLFLDPLACVCQHGPLYVSPRSAVLRRGACQFIPMCPFTGQEVYSQSDCSLSAPILGFFGDISAGPSPQPPAPFFFPQSIQGLLSAQVFPKDPQPCSSQRKGRSHCWSAVPASLCGIRPLAAHLWL